MLNKLSSQEVEPRPRHVAPKKTPTLQMVSQISTFNTSTLKVPENQLASKPEAKPPNMWTSNRTLQSQDAMLALNHNAAAAINEYEQSNRPAHAPNLSLIGGIDAGGNQWTTAASDPNSNTLNSKAVRTKKLWANQNNQVSPITGQVLQNSIVTPQLNNRGPEVDEDPDASLHPLVRRFKEKIVSRGSSGFIGLQRKFKIMDDDGSKSLNMLEFKKALKETVPEMSDSEVSTLFRMFDRDNDGAIHFEEFLQILAGRMNKRRRGIVDLAFNVLDRDGSGEVDLADMIQIYNVSQHPEFKTGKKTKEQILRELIDVFDVGGEKDGVVTRQEFHNYYQQISASIENDTMFELMVRNAWHISGGEGQAANSSNRRVLVTRADGTQCVEEIKNDLGLDPKDKAGALARLQKQGVAAVNLEFAGGSEDKNQRYRPGSAAPARSQNGAAAARGGGGAVSRNTQSFTPAMLAAPGAGDESMPDDDNDNGDGMHPLMRKFKERIVARGGSSGIVGLQRKFKIMDDDGSKSLNMAEFKKAMKETVPEFTDTDISTLFRLFDTTRSGSIDFEHFLQALAGKMNKQRRDIVNLAFNVLDQDGSGQVDMNDMIKIYDVTHHPEYKSGKKTREQVLRELIDVFDVGGEKDGIVTRQEFQAYYQQISAGIDNDNMFELMVRNAWHISGGVGQAANTANRRVLVTRADGSQYVEEIKSDLGLGAKDRDGAIARLKRQGVDASNIEFNGGMEDKNQRYRPGSAAPTVGRGSAGGAMPRTAAGAYAYAGAGAGAGGSLARGRTTNNIAAMGYPGGGDQSLPPGGDEEDGGDDMHPLLRKFKERVIARGCGGIIGLQRKFKIMDDDGSKSLNMAEFKKAMKETVPEFSDTDVSTLFRLFDTGRSGSIDFEHFLQALAGRMNKQRRNIVNLAYNVLDKDGSGEVDINDLIGVYDVTCHPDYKAGKKTRDQILRELIDVFDVGGEKDGKITRKEFQNYYQQLSAGIDNDNMFELMVRNAWHISGGEGQAANTANRRVLVTRADGSQGVEEIKSDLGLGAKDRDGAIARLKKQGVDAANIEFAGGMEDKNQRYRPGGAAPPLVRAQRPASAGATRSTGNPYRQQMLQSQANQQLQEQRAVESLIADVRTQLIGDDGNGIIDLQRLFRDVDSDGSGALNLKEFTEAIRNCRILVNSDQVRRIFNYFDSDNSGEISFEEFINVIRGPLSAKRKFLVDQAFDSMDTRSRGVIEPQLISQTFNPFQHPDVLSKIKSPQEVQQDFSDHFDVGGMIAGKVTKEEFANYYANIGASIASDDYFEMLIRNCWNLPASLNAANTRSPDKTKAGAKGGLQQQQPQAGAGKLAAPPPNLLNQLSGMTALQNVKAGVEPPPPKPTPMEIAYAGPTASAEPAPAAPAAPVLPPRVSTGVRLINPAAAAKFVPTETSIITPGVSMLISKLQADIQSRGIHGYNELERLFWMMDEDRSGELSLPEFNNVMKELGVQLDSTQLRKMFETFDKDQSESISIDEFMDAIRSKLSEKRLKLVQAAFAKLDKARRGRIKAEDLVVSYDPSQHPEVMAGRMSIKACQQEFLETFDIGKEVEGFATQREFIAHYTNLGCSITNDDYFELLITNTWKLDEREVQRATSSSSTSNLVSRLRGSVQKPFPTAEVEQLKLEAVNKFNERLYARSVQIFEQILSLLNSCGVGSDHPEYTKTLRSIEMVKRKGGLI